MGTIFQARLGLCILMVWILVVVAGRSRVCLLDQAKLWGQAWGRGPSCFPDWYICGWVGGHYCMCSFFFLPVTKFIPAFLTKNTKSQRFLQDVGMCRL